MDRDLIIEAVKTGVENSTRIQAMCGQLDHIDTTLHDANDGLVVRFSHLESDVNSLKQIHDDKKTTRIKLFVQGFGAVMAVVLSAIIGWAVKGQ